jgi:S1-C subfamily serine protease
VHEAGPQQRIRRGRRTLKGQLFRLFAVTTLLAVTGLALSAVVHWQQRTRPASLVPNGTATIGTDSPPPVGPRAESPPPPAAAAPDAAAILLTLQRGVVEIQSDRPGDEGALGAGFVIDGSGLVATSYHVVSAATRARVRFKDGSVYDVSGYAALDPGVDLAILQLQDPPDHLQSVRLRHDDPTQLAPVVAVGHPQGVEFSTFDGTVSRVVNTSQLPGRSRAFLNQLMPGGIDHRWIQHTARIAEGYSGGPLLNRDGEVIGINIWTDQQTGVGYALHVDHLHRLQQGMFPEAAPLEKYARLEARTADLARRLSARFLMQRFEDGQAMEWMPASPRDYDKLQGNHLRQSAADSGRRVPARRFGGCRARRTGRRRRPDHR